MSKHKKHNEYKPDNIDNENKVNQQYNPQYNPRLNNMGLDRLVNIMGNIDINKLAELLNNFNFNNDGTEDVNQKNNIEKENTCKKDINQNIEYNEVNDEISKNSSNVLANNQGIIINKDKIENLLLSLKDIADSKNSRELQELINLYLSK